MTWVDTEPDTLRGRVGRMGKKIATGLVGGLTQRARRKTVSKESAPDSLRRGVYVFQRHPDSVRKSWRSCSCNPTRAAAMIDVEPDDHELLVDVAIAEYLRRQHDSSFDRDEWLARHPNAADELAE